jgi:hypothetical protein
MEALKRLMATEAYRGLRRSWRLLDNLQIRTDSIGEYMYTPLERERADSLITALASLEEGLLAASETEVVATAAQTVAGVAWERAMQLSRPRTSMMTRMVPPWSMTTREELLGDVERRLQTLHDLHARGRLEDGEASAAMDTIVARMHAWSVIGAISESGVGSGFPYYPTTPSEDPLDTAMDLLEARHRAAMDTLAKYPRGEAPPSCRSEPEQHRQLMETLRKHEAALPCVRVMLADLLDGGA